jgi:hypothetical protein
VATTSAVLEAVNRASQRSRALVREGLKDGVYDLAIIASIAPWLGIYGTIVGIVNSFQGLGTEKWTGIAAVCKGLSQAVGFTALGLLVGVVAFWFYWYLSERLGELDREMENASLDLLNQLTRLPMRFVIDPSVDRPVFGETFGELPADAITREEKFFRRSLLAAPALLALAWLAQAFRLSAVDACIWTPLLLAVCCIFVYPFWSRFLRRRPGTMLALASGLCLCWTLAEFVLGKSLP